MLNNPELMRQVCTLIVIWMSESVKMFPDIPPSKLPAMDEGSFKTWT